MKIKSTTVVTPSSMNVIISDIDSDKTTRNAKGKLLRDRIAVKRKLECEWNGLTQAQAKTILSNCQDEFFSITYFDALEAKEVTKTFYAGDRTADIYTLNNLPSQIRYRTLRIAFIER